MYERLGMQWASSLLGFISLACCAIPFCSWKWGAYIRTKSRFAYAGDDEQEEHNDPGSSHAAEGDVEKGLPPTRNG